MKLSTAQTRALGKLTVQWQSAYTLQESLETLRALVRKKSAEIHYDSGSFFMPRNCIYFRRSGAGTRRGEE